MTGVLSSAAGAAGSAANRAGEGPALAPADLEALLAVTRGLAAPFELHTMLEEVADAACRLLRAERASVWLQEGGTHLRLEVASDLAALSVPIGTGLVGRCAQERRVINVPDCYADPRFNAEMDRRSGFRTRCLLALPLVDHRDELVGVLQLLNRDSGVFTAADEPLAQALAAQCAVALSRVRMIEAQLASEVLQHEVELARDLQRSTLPARAPEVPGYSIHGLFQPASLTGGDTWDAAPVGGETLLLLADATGHGLPAALAVVQMHAMLRLALDMGVGLATAYRSVNDRLAAASNDGRFVTAFVGLLDPVRHTVLYVSGGQGPILHWQAAGGAVLRHRATLFPMGAMPLAAAPRVSEIALAVGDRLVLLSDGFFEYEDSEGRPFGADGAARVLAEHPHAAPEDLALALLSAVQRHAGVALQQDDMTAVVVRRDG